MTSPIKEPTSSILEADDGAESGYETSSTKQSDTTSLASSLQEYLVENGKSTPY